MLTLNELDIKGKRVLIREDFNVPIKNGEIQEATRIQRALPTIRYCLDRGAQVILVSHLGRPIPGIFDENSTLAPIASFLQKALSHPVNLVKNWQQGIPKTSDITLLENARCYSGEKENLPQLARQLAALCDVFVMDAFATSHRTEASTVGVAEYAPIACGGPLLIEELNSLKQALHNPERPLVAILGGAKVSDKLMVISSLLERVNTLIVGGGIANTFLAAAGYPVGTSLYEPELIPEAQLLLKKAKTLKINFPLPVDVLVSEKISLTTPTAYRDVTAVCPNDKILDIGPKTIAQYVELINQANTILWNGPVGVFEFEPFEKGTSSVGKAIANSHAFSIAGGGDTLSAIAKFNLSNGISYISTGGGAFLSFIKHNLPAVDILETRSALWKKDIELR